ncbi:MAG: hypothetical protein C0490_23910, partial [Marivirga sp.]|nr:hypothetical protein [Marivirga sp.]
MEKSYRRFRNIAQKIVIIFFLIGIACVDRINLDIPESGAYAVVIDGFISDRPGPYEVTVTKAYDIQSKNSPRAHISVKRMILSDDLGVDEELL